MSELRHNPHDRLIRSAKEASHPDGIRFSWIGVRVPERIILVDPEDPTKVLMDEPVGYMRDGMVMSQAGAMLGTYERTIDYQKQPDGTILNEIIFHPVDTKLLAEAFFSDSDSEEGPSSDGLSGKPQ